MGIEKVIPRLADAEVFLKLLPRSASGQKITANVSFLTGTKNPPEVGGAEEYHVVILDNGRSDILSNPHLRETLFCIRCGACLNACPVYQKIGGHAYGWVYPGPIGAILTPQLIGRQQAADLPFASSLCGACREVCPVKINLPDMLLHLRHEIKEKAATQTPGDVRRRADDATPRTPADDKEARHQSGDRAPAFKLRLANWAEHAVFRFWAATMKGGARYRRARQLLLLAQRAFGDKGADGRRTPYMPPWTATRDLPPLAQQSFREQWQELSKQNDPVDK
jgi:L-lactate dehydrogenase complex protein LldF